MFRALRRTPKPTRCPMIRSNWHGVHLKMTVAALWRITSSRNSTPIRASGWKPAPVDSLIATWRISCRINSINSVFWLRISSELVHHQNRRKLFRPWVTNISHGDVEQENRWGSSFRHGGQSKTTSGQRRWSFATQEQRFTSLGQLRSMLYVQTSTHSLVE